MLACNMVCAAYVQIHQHLHEHPSAPTGLRISEQVKGLALCRGADVSLTVRMLGSLPACGNGKAVLAGCADVYGS